MQKGRFGIILPFYAVVSFLAALLGQPLLCLTVLGFAIVFEKNDWLNKQLIQALLLGLFLSPVGKFFGDFLFTDRIDEAFFLGFFLYIPRFLFSAVQVAAIVFTVLALVRVTKGQNANIPIASRVADWAYGIASQGGYSVNRNSHMDGPGGPQGFYGAPPQNPDPRWNNPNSPQGQPPTTPFVNQPPGWQPPYQGQPPVPPVDQPSPPDGQPPFDHQP